MNLVNLVREYRTKYGMEMPTLKLSRIIYNENKLMFKDIEHVRTKLRYAEGKTGEKNRIKIKDSEFKMDEHRPKNPYNLPESFQEKREPFKLPVGCNNILLISDLHIPYHDIDAITAALNYGVENKVNTIFINGDLIDNAQVSKFEKNLNKRSVKLEFDSTKSFLVSLRNVFPNASIYWLKGNHCIRWEKWLAMKVHEIWDDPYFHLEERLQLHEQKITIIDDKVLVKAGKLNITHGHHVFRSSAASPAKGAYNKTRSNIIIGHLHRNSQNIELDIDGNITRTYSTGCLCELRPDYNPLVGNSEHGAAHILIDSNGDFTIKPLPIRNGKITAI
jgi:predicted phosphodiesterase